MKIVTLAVGLCLSLVVAGCSNSDNAPSNSNITFSAALLPSNEAPNPITNSESTSSGSATIVFVPTKDSGGNITSAVGTASVTMQGFPAGSTITLSHIHTGATGVAGPVYVPFVPSANVPTVNGAASFSQTDNVTADQMTSLMHNPAGFYFNVHTVQNPGGVMRGQLVRAQ
jgi:hypothetical protein